MPTRLEKNLQHSKAAYLFAINSLPFPKDFPIRVNGMEFSKKSQIDSMEIEFGWSFFCAGVCLRMCFRVCVRVRSSFVACSRVSSPGLRPVLVPSVRFGFCILRVSVPRVYPVRG